MIVYICSKKRLIILQAKIKQELFCTPHWLDLNRPSWQCEYTVPPYLLIVLLVVVGFFN